MSRLFPAVPALLFAMSAAAGVAAVEPVSLQLALEPGRAHQIVLTRERAVDNDGHWLIEARSRTFATLEVLERAAEGYLLRWRIDRIVHDIAPGDPSTVAKKLGSIAVGLEFAVSTDATGRPLAIEDRERVRDFVRQATDRTVAGIEADLAEQGYPREQIAPVGRAMRRPFLELADAPDARFDRVYLSDAMLLLDLMGTSFVPGEELQRRAPGTVPMLDGREPLLIVRERMAPLEAAATEAEIERIETLAEPISPREVLSRFPGILAMVARMNEAQQEAALAELPPVSFERRTRWWIDLATGLPRRVEREEKIAIGDLARRTLVTAEVTGSPREPRR